MSTSPHSHRQAPGDRVESGSEPTAGDLARRISDVTIADAYRLRKRLTAVRRMPERSRRRELGRLAQRVERAERRIANRRLAIPEIRFPRELPVSGRVDDLADAIRENQVVVVAGETGSGKSTQLPKICLQLGRGIRGTIGHTQPRRIAARTLAERIAQETGTVVGASVGYAVRFDDHTGPRTLVKLMTDGILLAESASDPELRAYDTIIIDEAHERSLNIDFLLGYLARLLPRRPELKLIITSATIDPEKFSKHFSDAPIVEVSGRTYPVEIRYRPTLPDTGFDLDDDAATRHADGIDQPTAICRAVDELLPAGDGDILVFLSGEREINDTTDALRAHLTRRGGLAAHIEVLPLYGRLSMADQHKVFAPSGRRRIVPATNVAETSLTVPGIRYVIDPGTARISRYSPRTKVQRLPIEKISQASAGQRAGRCGRVADGICIRLYSEDDFDARAEFTDPEIARTALASVILRMAALGLGDIETFPFVDPPEAKLITDGMTVLSELGALEPSASRSGQVQLTDTGRKLAALPVDPRLARILVEADRLGCLAEILVIVSALTIRDVREYPVDERDKAVASHARFADPTSDFLSSLGLWHYLVRQGKALSGNKFRKLCKAEYLHFLRIREWQDLHTQLTRSVSELGMDPGKTADEADREAVHTALLAGLLSHIAARIAPDSKSNRQPRGDRKRRPSREYQGTRGSTVLIWPGSSLAKTRAPLIVAAEMVETSRSFARTVAAVDSAWVERVGGQLLRRHYADPYFSTKRNAVMATETVMLLGVTIVQGRAVAYDRVDPAQARELLIRRGLVEGQLTLPLPFLQANQRTLADVSESERRARRRDIAIDDEALFALYDERLPADVTSGNRLDSWWRKESRTDPGLLTFTREMLISADAALTSPAEYPDSIDASGVPLELDYVFEPGAANDGISATVPLAALASIDPRSLPAQVPGLRRDLALALIKSLPKQQRRALVPAPDFADAALAHIGDDLGALPDRLAEQLAKLGGLPVTADDFDYAKVPDHLRMRFTVVDDDGTALAEGSDLVEMQRSLRAEARTAVAKAGAAIERREITTFPPAGLPRTTSVDVAGQAVSGYPAFVDDGHAVSIRVYTDQDDQRRAMRRGTRRLLALARAKQIAALATLVRQQGSATRPAAPGATPDIRRPQVLLLATAPHGSMGDLIADAADSAIDALLDWAGGPAWDSAAFDVLERRIAGQLEKAVMDIVLATATTLAADAKAQAAIDELAGPHAGAGEAAVAEQLRQERQSWLAPGFIAAVGAAHLPDVTRYLTAITVRAERYMQHPERDHQRAGEVNELRHALAAKLAEIRPERAIDADVLTVQRLIAEYRITLFAQPMRTAVPVSAKRIRTAIAALQY